MHLFFPNPLIIPNHAENKPRGWNSFNDVLKPANKNISIELFANALHEPRSRKTLTKRILNIAHSQTTKGVQCLAIEGRIE